MYIPVNDSHKNRTSLFGSLFLAFVIGIAVLLLSGTSSAGLWNELNDEEKEQALTFVQGQLNSDLSSDSSALLPDGRLKTFVSALTSANWKDISRHAGEISAGNYKQALNASLAWGAGNLGEYFKEKALDKMPDGPMKSAVGHVLGKTDSLKKIGQAALNPKMNWGQVSTLFWKEAKSQAKADLEGYAESTVKQTINFAFGNQSFLNYSAGDLYMLIIKAEIEFLEYLPKKITHEVGTNLYKLYMKNNGNWSAFDHEIYSGWGGGGRGTQGLDYRNSYSFVTRQYPDGQLEQMFSYCRSKGETSWMACVWAMENKLKREAEQKKRELNNKLKQGGQEARENLKKLYANIGNALSLQIQKIIEERADEELKKKIEAAIKEANKELHMMQVQTNGILKMCSEISAFKATAESARNQLAAAAQAVNALAGYVAKAGECGEVAKEASKIQKGIQQANTLKTQFEQYYIQADEASTESCNWDKPTSKREALDTSKKAISAGRRASSAISKANAKASELETFASKHQDVTLQFIAKYGLAKTNEMIAAVRKIDELLSLINSSKNLGPVFSGAVSNIKSHQAIIPTRYETVKGFHQKIKSILNPYKDHSVAKTILGTSGSFKDNALGCKVDADMGDNSFNESSLTEVRQYRDQVLRADLSGAAAVKNLCNSLANVPSAIQLLQPVLSANNKVKGMKGDLAAFKWAYETCIASALSYVNKFKDDDDDDDDDKKDKCPDDPDKTEPGICGCNKPETDSDNDDICDDKDKCNGDDSTGDSDSDGVCDDRDKCNGDDLTGDSDSDGVCDDKDKCKGNDATGDSDKDKVCNSDDACPGKDDFLDANNNGTPDCKEKKCRNDQELFSGKCVPKCGRDESRDASGNCVFDPRSEIKNRPEPACTLETGCNDPDEVCVNFQCIARKSQEEVTQLTGAGGQPPRGPRSGAAGGGPPVSVTEETEEEKPLLPPHHPPRVIFGEEEEVFVGTFTGQRQSRGSRQAGRPGSGGGRQPAKPPESPKPPERPKNVYYIINKEASGIWHWKNYKCSETNYELLVTEKDKANEKIEDIRKRWNESNQKCKDKGCDRGALYSRIWRPQSWSVSVDKGPLDKSPEVPKGKKECTGEMN